MITLNGNRPRTYIYCMHAVSSRDKCWLELRHFCDMWVHVFSSSSVFLCSCRGIKGIYPCFFLLVRVECPPNSYRVVEKTFGRESKSRIPTLFKSPVFLVVLEEGVLK